MDEVEIIRAACAGSETAFQQLHKKHLPYVRAVGRAILHTNDLDDFCQETFLLAFTRIKSFQGDANFRTWITRIAMNQCLMTLRRRRQVTNGESHLVQLESSEPGDDLLQQCVFTTEDRALRSAAARLDLPKILSALDAGQRQILELAYLEELSEQEIACRLGISVAAVKSRIHQAKKRARTAEAKRTLPHSSQKQA